MRGGERREREERRERKREGVKEERMRGEKGREREEGGVREGGRDLEYSSLCSESLLNTECETQSAVRGFGLAV